jgi:hypothetical protein
MPDAKSQIVDGSGSFETSADDVPTILGAGRVYVGGQATGVADGTVVVGEDLAGD